MKEAIEQIDFLKENGKMLNTTNYTYKSPELIGMSYDLSITEQRIITLGCKKIQPIYIENKLLPSQLDTALSAIKFRQIKITVNEYKREYGIVSKNIYKILKETIKDFFEKKVSYYEKGKLMDKRWISTAGYDDKNGCFYLTFNQDMLEDLLVFKGKFVALFFDMSQNIKSKYAFRIYEILKSNSYIKTYDVSLEEFKFMLNIEDDSYTDFYKFNTKVIKPNIKVINEHSDIHVEFEPLRNGRSVTHLRFKIKNIPNKVVSPDLNFKDKIPKSFAEVENALKEYNITLTSGDAEKLFTKAVEITISKKINKSATDYILEKIEYMKKYAVDVKDVRTAIGWILWAMKKDYHYQDDSIKTPKKKLGFDNFKGRDYSDEEWNNIENGLLYGDYEDEEAEEYDD